MKTKRKHNKKESYNAKMNVLRYITPSFKFGGVKIYTFLFFCFIYIAKTEIIEIKTRDKEDLKKILKVDNSVPFNVYYIFAKKYCGRCYNLEIKNGWFDTPIFLKRTLQINFITNIKKFKNYLKDLDTGNYILHYYDNQDDKKIIKYVNKAIFVDNINDRLFSYKIASDDFGKMYRYFDSVLFNSDKYTLTDRNIKLYNSFLTDIPNYIDELKISFSLKKKLISIFSRQEKILWKYDINGIKSSKISLDVNTDIQKFVKKGESKYYHDFLIQFENSKNSFSNSVLLSDYVDTVIFNRRTHRWKRYQQQIICYSNVHDENYLLVDTIVNLKERIGTFAKSINYDILWGGYYLANKDTIYGVFKLFYITNNKFRNFKLPLKYYSSNHEFTTSYNTSLYTVSLYGEIFKIDTNLKVKTSRLSYNNNDRRIFTFFDGRNFSITSHNNNYSYLVVFNKNGIRKYNFTTKKFYAYYFYLSEQQAIIEITKGNDKLGKWLINLYELNL